MATPRGKRLHHLMKAFDKGNIMMVASKIFRNGLIISFAVIIFALSAGSYAQDLVGPTVSKRFITDNYVGSFKIDYYDDVSTTAYAQGRVAFNPDHNSVFIDSHIYQLAIAEFKIPQDLSKSGNKEELPNAEVMQGFTKVIERTQTGNQGGLDRIGGMDIINGRLFVQSYRAYDASGSKQTTLVVENPSDLKGSMVSGFYEMEGTARTVNYLSPVPVKWQNVLGGSYVAGNGGGMSIVSRLSAGPSLFTFSPEDIVRGQWNIDTTRWMNYPVNNALSTTVVQDFSVQGYGAWDVFNDSGQNDLWTDVSVAAFGFIIPGTDSFFVIGSSGMHQSGGGYKITNSAGYTCPGACASDNTDYNSYYWIYDMKDIIAADEPHSVLPYEYGVFDDRWMEYGQQRGVGGVTGGSFDARSGTLVLSHAAATSSHESGSPIISVYKIPVPAPPGPPTGVGIN